MKRTDLTGLGLTDPHLTDHSDHTDVATGEAKALSVSLFRSWPSSKRARRSTRTSATPWSS